jgi:Methyltransferase domain
MVIRDLHELNLVSDYSGRERVVAVSSSYRRNNFDLVFYSLMRQLRPETVVELGVLEGFSLMAMASGLRDNGSGHITGYDLFERYPFRHAGFNEVQNRLRNAQLVHYITLLQADAENAASLHNEVDVLHVDLSNDGDTYRRFFAQWSDKVRLAILLEGGSMERDQVQWMRQYGKPPIAAALDDIEAVSPDWQFTLLKPFPSITIALRQ